MDYCRGSRKNKKATGKIRFGTNYVNSGGVTAQIVNVNPDPNGDPWLIGGYYVSPEAQILIDSLPEFETNNVSKSTPLPFVVDNSTEQFFRPIFTQDGGSCAQASAVGYIFTYMVNRMRYLPANTSSNQYPTHYTWNEKNDGVGNGSTMTEGWNIISTNGCPNVQNYGGLYMFPTEPEPCTNRRTVRQTGYNNYFEAMHNMVLDNQFIINFITSDDVETTKHYLYDLGEGNITLGGGILSFAADMSSQGVGMSVLPPESDEAGKYVITHFGSNQDNHAMTIVGYNDNIKFDFNGDGDFTNPDDNISQWEIGAFKVANSWGLSWPGGAYTDGFIYVPYRLFKYREIFGISINENPYHEPKVTVKVKLHHNKRSRVSLRTGLTDDPSSTSYLNIVYYQFVGGSGQLPMQGINTDPIEIELDVTKILDDIIPGKFRFWIPMVNNDPTHYGEVLELALYDYDTQDGIPVITTYSGSLPSQIVYGIYSNQFPIEYDYLPSDINSEILVERDLEIQKDIRILENGVLTISNSTFSLLSNKSIEVYPGGRLIIDDGGELVVSGNSEIKIYEDTNNPGVLVFNSGALIQLTDNSTVLDVAGNLEIADNTQFTFTGNGYVKFSNPGPDATYNITAGTRASILFSGNGQADKVLEVSQATVHFPEMASLTFENCRIEMASGTPGRRM